MTRIHARTYAVLAKRFRPITQNDGTPLHPLNKLSEAQRRAFRHWWTLIDCDGRLYLSPGFHFVNRLAYLRCEVPWTAADAHIDYRYD